jgi:CheY-like chemotaxis protein
MSGKRILIVDDTKEIGRMIQAALETLDPSLQVSVLTNAEDALLALPRQPIDMMVVDVRLPGISGLELTRKLRARRQTAKVIQISGVNDPHLKEQSIEMGADMFFPKPLVMSEFLDAVQQLLGIEKRGLGGAPSASAVDQLAGLRGRLGAAAVVLVDAYGRMVAQEGDLPSGWTAAAENKPDGLPLLGADLRDALVESLAAAEKAAPLLGNPGGEKVLVWRGESVDLVAAPIAPEFQLLVILYRTASAVRLAIALDEVLAAQKALENELLGVPLPEPTPGAPKSKVTRPVTLPPAAPVAKTGAAAAPAGSASGRETANPASSAKAPAHSEDERLARELESLMRKPGKAALKPADVDSFWEQVSTQQENALQANPDVLSFDQARQMGLAPGEAD